MEKVITIREVQVECNRCEEESTTFMVFGTNKDNKEDFYMSCDRCGNTEEGTLPTQYFKVIETISIEDYTLTEED